MSRVHLFLSLAVLVTLLALRSLASASIPMWTLQRCDVSIPANARLIIASENIEDLRAALPIGKIRSVRSLDEEHVEVEIKSTAGSTLKLYERFPGACGRFEAMVQDNWSPTFPPIGVTHVRSEPDTLWIEWNGLDRNRPALFWTRIDWADNLADLRAGKHKSELLNNDQTYLNWHELKTNHLFVRLVRYLPDGSEQFWTGWIHRDEQGQVTFGKNPQVAKPKRRSRPSHR